MGTIDSDPGTLIVTHGPGARSCIDAIMGLVLRGDAARKVQTHKARPVLLAIAGTNEPELQWMRSGIGDRVLYGQIVRTLAGEGLIRLIKDHHEPDWLGIARYTHGGS